MNYHSDGEGVGAEKGVKVNMPCIGNFSSSDLY